jgi:hypothetical protein
MLDDMMVTLYVQFTLNQVIVESPLFTGLSVIDSMGRWDNLVADFFFNPCNFISDHFSIDSSDALSLRTIIYPVIIVFLSSMPCPSPIAWRAQPNHHQII